MISMPLFTDMLLLAAAIPALLFLMVTVSGRSLRDEDDKASKPVRPNGFYHSPLLTERLQKEQARRDTAARHASTQCCCGQDRTSGEFWPEIPRETPADENAQLSGQTRDAATLTAQVELPR